MPLGVQDAAGPLPGRDEVFPAIERVLAAAEFAVAEPSSLEAFLLELQQKWQELLAWFVQTLASALGGSETAAQGVAILFVLGVAALAGYVLWHIFQARGAEERGTVRGRELPGASVAELPAAELTAASELARAGRYAEAMHGLYRGVLLWLDELGHARFDEGKTGGEYARELRAAELRPPFKALLSSFYPVAFGGRAGGDSAWRAMRAAASSMGVPE